MVMIQHPLISFGNQITEEFDIEVCESMKR